MMPKTFEIKPVVYDDLRPLIRNGDVALSRPSSIEGRLICGSTNAVYSHATLLGWARPHTLMLGETRQHRDARLIDARSEFSRWPGYYDIFRPYRNYALNGEHIRFEYQGDWAWSFVCHAAGTQYGWRHISRAWLRRYAGWDVEPIANSNSPRWPRDCSALVHAALRLAGRPKLRQFDCDVVPGDLANPAYFRYLGTVFADKHQVYSFFNAIAQHAQIVIDGFLPLMPAEAVVDLDPEDSGW